MAREAAQAAELEYVAEHSATVTESPDDPPRASSSSSPHPIWIATAPPEAGSSSSTSSRAQASRTLLATLGRRTGADTTA